jgi:predicted deacylase
MAAAGNLSHSERNDPAAEASLRCTVDLDQSGKQVGTLWVPDSRNNLSAWGSIAVPIGCIKNGNGPTVLVLAGNHGDEYESQLALFGLLAEIEPSQVTGRLIVIPSLTTPGAAAGTRLWPDGTNFNRAFPGKPDGTAPDQLAYHLTSVLFPMADVICDFHTGGRSLAFQPMATLHLVDEPKQRQRMVDAAVAMGTGWVLAYIDVNGGGLLPTQAESLGKTVVTAELGGGGLVTAKAVAQTRGWIRNVLRDCGVLEDEPEAGDAPRQEMRTRVLRSTTPEDYVLAPVAGLYEPLIDLGAEVTAGSVLGRIHSLENISRPAEPVLAKSSGILAAIRAITTTDAGDCVALVGQESNVEDLIDTGAGPR